MVIFPKAKINIGLRIIEKRPDGFHNLQTIFYPVCLSDAIEFIVPDISLHEDVLQVTGIMTGQDPASNLIMKAIKRMRESSNVPFLKVHLHKAIPLGAGLGGGSSDAACVIKSLNRHFNLGLSDEDLKKIALELGSDCPFFIDSLPAYGEGRGDHLMSINPLSEGYHLVMVNPGIHINTKDAYSNCIPKLPETNLKELYNLEITEWKDLIINDFEEYIFRVFPQIADLKKSLYDMGAIYSSMSGSGSTVYGIFKIKPVIPSFLKSQVIYSDIL
jgi:4-diphosphocytidyl-2-C-methyl-D-erythritol kinase